LKAPARIRAWLKELFLLRAAEDRVRSRTPEQADLVRLYATAADQRLVSARDLASPAGAASASLLRDALSCALRAQAASRDASLDREQLASLDISAALEALMSVGTPPGLTWQEAHASLATSDPLFFDAMSEQKLEEVHTQLDGVVTFVRNRIDARTTRQVRIARWGRLFVAAGLLLGLLAFGLWRSLTPVSIAVGKPVRSSSLHFGDRPASALVNGEVESTWGLHTRTENSPWAVIDLEEPRKLNLIRVHNRGDGWFDDCLPLVAELSLDGKQFTELARRSTHFDQDRPWRVRANGQRARYVRLRVDRTSYLSLSEVYVYAY
jgi:hypothetical protein